MTEQIRELAPAEIDLASGGKYIDYNFTVLGIHFWGGTYDGHQYDCWAINGNGKCTMEGAK